MKIQRQGESIYLKDEIFGMVEVDITAKYGLSNEEYQILLKPDKVCFDLFYCLLSALIGLIFDMVIRIVEKWDGALNLRDAVISCQIFGIFVLIILLLYTYRRHRAKIVMDPEKKNLLDLIKEFYIEKNNLIKSSLANINKIR